jgi:transporter family protein
MNWLSWALLSALFAGVTAVLAKVGVAEVNSHMATAIRTGATLIFTSSIALLSVKPGAWLSIAPRAWVVLILSGLATGLSWLCYFRTLQLGEVSQVAPLDKLTVAVALAGVPAFTPRSQTLFGDALAGETLFRGWVNAVVGEYGRRIAKRSFVGSVRSQTEFGNEEPTRRNEKGGWRSGRLARTRANGREAESQCGRNSDERVVSARDRKAGASTHLTAARERRSSASVRVKPPSRGGPGYCRYTPAFAASFRR